MAFHFPIRITCSNGWNSGKIVKRWRRRCRPLQCTSVPWVAGGFCQLPFLDNARNDLDNLQYYGSSNNNSAQQCQYKERLPAGRRVIMVEPAGCSHKSEYIKRDKGHAKPKYPTPKYIPAD